MIVSRLGGQAAPRTGHVSSELRLIRIPGFERLSRFFAAVSRDPSSRFPSLHLLHQVSQFQFTESTRSLPMFFSSSISRWKSNRVARLRKMAPRGEQGNPFSFPYVCVCVCVCVCWIRTHGEMLDLWRISVLQPDEAILSREDPEHLHLPRMEDFLVLFEGYIFDVGYHLLVNNSWGYWWNDGYFFFFFRNFIMDYEFFLMWFKK